MWNTLRRFPPTLFLLLIPILYLATLAQTPIFGDPTEYTFVAHVLGVAHPPGYALMTVIGKLFQTLIPFGTIAWRTHLVGATAGTLLALCVYGTVHAIASQQKLAVRATWPALFAALIVAFATNQWQHSIHANPHIITATFLAFNLFVLTKWFFGVQDLTAKPPSRQEERGRRTTTNRWLYAFCVSAGLGVTHHPLTVFMLPAAVLFVLWVRPSILRDWRTLLKGTGFVLLGLLVWGYFPWRAGALTDTQFVSNMRTLDGFLDLVLARGLRVNLFAFGLRDQWDRATVFWTLLHIQHTLPIIFLAILGIFWLTAASLTELPEATNSTTPATAASLTELPEATNSTTPATAASLTELPEAANSTTPQPRTPATAASLTELPEAVNSTTPATAASLTELPEATNSTTPQPRNFATAASLTELPEAANSTTPQPLLLLYLGSFLLNYAFVMNTVQDVMAYLLGPFLIVGLLAGIGLTGLLAQLAASKIDMGEREYGLLLAFVFMLGTGFQLLNNAPYISLRDYSEGDDYIAEIRDKFAGQAESAVLLNDWEHMTPIWYETLVEGKAFDSAEITPKFVSAALPWLEGVFANLPAGPLYLSRFERSIFDTAFTLPPGFRLRPRGDEMWQVVEPNDTSLPPELSAISGQGGAVEIVGYRLPASVQAGELVDFDLAMRVSEKTDAIYMPVLKIGDVTLNFTTDSHLLTPQWQPNEIIVERFEFVTPHNWAAQSVPVTLEIHDLTGGTGNTGLALPLGDLAITAAPFAPRTDQLLANFRQRVGLRNAWVRNGLFERRRAEWEQPLLAKTGDTIHVTLQWEVLAKPEDSYTVFVHLIDLGNRPIIDSLDYTPLGGATPSHLWFPKWLPNQKMLDPYQLKLDGVPAGEYLIEVGIYEQFSKRRLHIYDNLGNLNGDRFILGKLIVEP